MRTVLADPCFISTKVIIALSRPSPYNLYPDKKILSYKKPKDAYAKAYNIIVGWSPLKSNQLTFSTGQLKHVVESYRDKPPLYYLGR